MSAAALIARIAAARSPLEELGVEVQAEAWPDTFPEEWTEAATGGGGGGDGPCPHSDTYLGLVEEGPTFCIIHRRCKACGEDLVSRLPIGRDGAE